MVRKRRTKKNVEKNGTVGLRSKQGFSSLTRFGSTKSPPIPRNLHVALREDIPFVLSGSTGAIDTDLYGLLEPLGRSPSYLSNFYGMYKYMRVKGVEVELTCVNTASYPIRVALATLPHQDVSVAGMTTLIEQPGSLSRLLSPTGGMDRVVFRKFYDCLNLVGSYGGDHFWIDVARATGTTPIDAREPVIVIGAAPIVSINWNISILARITYHVEFFDLHANPVLP